MAGEYCGFSEFDLLYICAGCVGRVDTASADFYTEELYSENLGDENMKAITTGMGALLCIVCVVLLVISLLGGCTPNDSSPGVTLLEEPESGSITLIFPEPEYVPPTLEEEEDMFGKVEVLEPNVPGEDENPPVDLGPGEMGQPEVIQVDIDGRPLDGSAPPDIERVHDASKLEGAKDLQGEEEQESTPESQPVQ